MDVNRYIDIAQNAAKGTLEKSSSVDHSAQVGIGMEIAKRQAEKPAVEIPKIPPLGVVPLAN